MLSDVCVYSALSPEIHHFMSSSHSLNYDSSFTAKNMNNLINNISLLLIKQNTIIYNGNNIIYKVETQAVFAEMHRSTLNRFVMI